MNINKRFLVLSGISGVGKSSAIKLLIGNHNFHFSISTTSRAMRQNEQHGKDYYFVTKSDFEHMIASNQFLEHVSFLDYYYGTEYQAITSNSHEQIILDLDYSGYHALKQKFSNVCGVFLHHDNMQEIQQRLINRSNLQSITPELQNRLNKAEMAIHTQHEYDYVINVTEMNIEQTTHAILQCFQFYYS